MDAVRKTTELVSSLLYGVAVIALICIVVLMNLRIASRNFDLGLNGLQLYAQMLSVWVVFIVAGILGIENRHIEMDYLARKLPDEIKPYHNLAVNLISLLMCTLLVAGGVLAMLEFWTGTSPSVNIPLPIYYIPVLIGIGMLGIVYLSAIGSAIRIIIVRRMRRFATQREDV